MRRRTQRRKQRQSSGTNWTGLDAGGLAACKPKIRRAAATPAADEESARFEQPDASVLAPDRHPRGGDKVDRQDCDGNRGTWRRCPRKQRGTKSARYTASADTVSMERKTRFRTRDAGVRLCERTRPPRRTVFQEPRRRHGKSRVESFLVSSLKASVRAQRAEARPRPIGVSERGPQRPSRLHIGSAGDSSQGAVRAVEPD